MRRRKIPFLTSIQYVFLTANLFIKNDLVTYASAGAYGFLLSILPIVMMILVILIRFLHASPDILINMLNFDSVFADSATLQKIIDSILSIHTIGFFEIFIGVSIFWMARRFFSSVMQGIKSIFRGRRADRPIKENLLVIAGEVLLVIIISVFILITIAANSLIGLPQLEELIPKVLYTFLRYILNYVPMVILFFFIYITYRVAPGTKPPKKLCLIFALLCTLSFTAVQIAFKYFIHLTTYNIVYGVLSNLIVILLEVFIFFILFLFFAQMIYVTQFFDMLLLTQLYLLPPRDDLDVLASTVRILFIRPRQFSGADFLFYQKDELIFKEGDEGNDIYYILNGTVELSSPNRLDYHIPGDFFGEVSYILSIPRTATARAVTDLQVFRITEEFFDEVLKQSPETGWKAVESVAAYVRRLKMRK